MQRVDEIRERAEKATDGPWGYGVQKDIAVNPHGLAFLYGPANGNIDKMQAFTSDDAAFIAHARSDIPWLLAEVARLRAALSFALAELEIEADGHVETASIHHAIEQARAALGDPS